MAEPHLRQDPCIAFIADMVKSREVPRRERPNLQERFNVLIGDLNQKYRRNLLSKFVVTLGDEFQGLLISATPLPDILWDLEEKFSDRELRVGIGFGVLYTPAPKVALNVDGHALHNARSALVFARDKRALGGVFNGFGETLDQILNGIARILWFHGTRFIHRQDKTITLLRQGLSQSEVAAHLRVSRQNASKKVTASGWVPYLEGETSWRTILATFVDPLIKGKHASAHE
jgi:hypothetical protein